MKSLSDRDPIFVAIAGLAAVVVITVASMFISGLSLVTGEKEYSAYLAQAGGLMAEQSPVEVSGAEVGRVTSVELDGPRVLVKFNVAKGVPLGDRTEAAVKMKTVLGAKLLEITPRGEGQLSEPIPLERTTPAYQLPEALSDLSMTISGLDTDQLSDSLAVLSHEFSDTPPALKVAVQGVARLSETIGARDEQLRNLLRDAKKVTTVLAERGDKVVNLVGNANALLAQLKTESQALDEIARNLSSATLELKGFIAEHRASLRPTLDKLNEVLEVVENRREEVQLTLKGMNSYLLSFGEALASGPFFKAYVANLLPGQFVQPFIDAAFSDLGLDPATLLPSQLHDPLVGQKATPPQPVPFPRTGQGGEPRLTVPDAITGNPGDTGGCVVPHAGCYPLKEEPPAPAPGGPPPGPPAESSDDGREVPHGVTAPVFDEGRGQ
ncbi:MCE family protein [Mycolicibacterium sp. XJ1819]